MDSHQRSAFDATSNSNGAKSGPRIGATLSIAANDAVKINEANHLYSCGSQDLFRRLWALLEGQLTLY
jgi:hypothetical protein